jgi:hypothetical protein
MSSRETCEESAHTINQNAKNTMNERRLTRNMQEKTNATLCFTCTSSNNHFERNQNIERIYHVKKKTTNYEETHD